MAVDGLETGKGLFSNDGLFALNSYGIIAILNGNSGFMTTRLIGK
jgi:hypothetical protein